MDMTPMIDLVFNLIIFFMVACDMVKAEDEDLQLPRALKTEKDEDPENRIVVNVTWSPNWKLDQVYSQIIIRKQAYNDINQLTAFLKNSADKYGKEGAGSKMRVKIRADARAEYKKIQQILVACMKAGVFKVQIGASPPFGG
jgi:biopolymer transport protein ExbD